MSRKGDCWDNAVAESFFATLKREMDNADNLISHTGAERAVREYIGGFYNIQRRHSAIDYNSPIEFELLHSMKRRAAQQNRPPKRVNPRMLTAMSWLGSTMWAMAPSELRAAIQRTGIPDGFPIDQVVAEMDALRKEAEEQLTRKNPPSAPLLLHHRINHAPCV